VDGYAIDAVANHRSFGETGRVHKGPTGRPMPFHVNQVCAEHPPDPCDGLTGGEVGAGRGRRVRVHVLGWCARLWLLPRRGHASRWTWAPRARSADKRIGTSMRLWDRLGT